MGDVILKIVLPLAPLYPGFLILTLFGFAARPIVRRLEMDEDRRKLVLWVLGFFHTAVLAFLALLTIGVMWSLMDAGRALQMDAP